MSETAAPAADPATVNEILAAASKPADGVAAAQSPAALPPPNDDVPFKSCACTKTKCLKLYCDCFSSGVHCGRSCECNDHCSNNAKDEEERSAAIKAVLDRKPEAFNDAIKEQVGWVAQEKAPTTGKKRGRPKGSLNKNKPIMLDIPEIKRPRGRPRKDETLKPPVKSLTPPSAPIEFSVEEYPQLAMDPNQDYSHLATSFTNPLFPPEDAPTSRPLQIAYSHQAVAQYARSVAQSKKNSVLDEYKRIREKYLEKKLELSLANDEVKKCNKEAGMWTKKVFDLELEEPCDWNEKLNKLRKYKEEHDKLPPKNVSRCEEGDEKELAIWLEKMRGNKLSQEVDDNEESSSPKKQPKVDLTDYPHRIEALKAFNIHFQQKTQNKFETMFQKLLDYKEEHGTLRFPSDEQCAASGDEEFIALQKWVKSQVLNFRYSKKKTDPSIVKRFVDIGFSFERWYAKPGKKKSDTKFDEIAKSAAEEAEADEHDQTMAADVDAEEEPDGQEAGQENEGNGNGDRLAEVEDHDETNLEYAQMVLEQV